MATSLSFLSARWSGRCDSPTMCTALGLPLAQKRRSPEQTEPPREQAWLAKGTLVRRKAFRGQTRPCGRRPAC